MRVGADSRSGRLRSIHHTGWSSDRAETVVPHCQSSPGRGINTWFQNLANKEVEGRMADVAMLTGIPPMAIGRWTSTGSAPTCAPVLVTG